MRAFFLWLGVSAVVWGGAAFGLDRYFGARPATVLVVVDTAFAMEGDWAAVGPLLDRIDNASYSQFALMGPRGPIHGPEAALSLGATQAYGTRDLSAVSGFGAGADRKILVTNAPDGELPDLPGWEVLRP
ncbi:MAG: hypothetical protein AAFU80_07450 [Pseudomonadota bacterium]